MNKRLYVGDLHGDVHLLNFILKHYSKHKLYFVGDLLDSFYFHPEDQVKCVQLMLDAIDKGVAECLLGNHELSYLYPKDMKCGGWKPQTNFMMAHLVQEVKTKFKSFIYDDENKILFTHAGLTKELWDKHRMDFENLAHKLTSLVPNLLSDLYKVGYSRYGSFPFGGIFWCDWNEEFHPIEDLTQIVGHTSKVTMDKLMDEILSDIGGMPINLDGIRMIGNNNYNIDCLTREYEFLEFDEETKQFNIINVPKEIVINLS